MDRRGPPPPWADLPADELGEIAGHISDATDLVRFRAVCRPWRKAPPLPQHRLLPWLIAGPISEFRPRLPIRSPFTKRSLYLRRAPDLRLRKLEWADAAHGRVLAVGIMNDDPMAALVNPLTGDATCFPLPHRPWARDEVGVFLGTIRIHLMTAMIRLRHDDDETGVTEKRRVVPLTYGPLRYPESVLLDRSSLRAAALCSSGVLAGGACAMAELPPAKSKCDRYVLECHGKLFCIDLQQQWQHPEHAQATLSVYVMEVGGDEGRRPRWVEWRDADDGHVCFFLGGESHNFFLGGESSFAVDARELAAGAELCGAGSCAFYVGRHPKWAEMKQVYGVYRYSFEDRVAVLLDELPAEFRIGSMWFVPLPRLPRHNN